MASWNNDFLLKELFGRCFCARSREKTTELYRRLRKENVIVSLREDNIRVSPHLYNTERDIDRSAEAILRCAASIGTPR